jgi:hypothetical protein
MNYWIGLTLLLIFGIVAAFWGHRITRWWARDGGTAILRAFPQLNFSGKNIDEMVDDWNKSGLHTFETIVIWFIRIIGAILALVSALILLGLILGLLVPRVV